MPHETYIDVGHVVRPVEFPYVIAELTDETPIKLGLRPVRVEDIIDRIKITIVYGEGRTKVLSTATHEEGDFHVIINSPYISELPSQTIVMDAIIYHDDTGGSQEYYPGITLTIPTELDTTTNPHGIFVKGFIGMSTLSSAVISQVDGFIVALQVPTVDSTLMQSFVSVYKYNAETGTSAQYNEWFLSNNDIGKDIDTENTVIVHDTTNFNKPYYAQELTITAYVQTAGGYDTVVYKYPVNPIFETHGVQESFLELADDVPAGTPNDPWILPDVTAIELGTIISAYFNSVWLGSGLTVIHDDAQHPIVQVRKYDNKVLVTFREVSDNLYTHLKYRLPYLGATQGEFNVTWESQEE